VFHNRSDRVVPESAFAVDVAPQPAAAPPKRDRRWMGRLTLILAPALILVFLLVARFGSHDSTSFSLRRLWGGFAADPATTAVVFPDAPGIADVRIMHRLDGLFAGLGRELRIESAAPSDAAAILVGEDGGILHDFRLQRAPAAVVNLRPQPGEPLNWTDTDTQKYAVVAMELSGNGGRQIMILAGATPADSEAAAEFACGTRGAGDLLERISGSRTGVVRPFEAVLRVSAQAGASAAPQLVAVHGAGG
jgi:hypothetical protein